MPKQRHHQARPGTVKFNKKEKQKSVTTKQENPVVKATENKVLNYLNELKEKMAGHMAKAKEAKDLRTQVKEGLAARNLYVDYMEKLMTVYNVNKVPKISSVEALKEDLRKMFEQTKETTEPLERELNILDYEAEQEKAAWDGMEDEDIGTPEEQIKKAKEIASQIAAEHHAKELEKLTKDLEKYQKEELGLGKEKKKEPRVTIVEMLQKQKNHIEQTKIAANKKEQKALAQLHKQREEFTSELYAEFEPKIKQKLEKIQGLMKKIDTVLDDLLIDTMRIGQHLPEAQIVAKKMHATLEQARNAYETHLVTGKENGKRIDPQQAGELFKAKCRSAIDAAMPVLERDLSWGDYLKNLLKSILNIVSVPVAGVFFAPVPSKASEVASKAGQALQNDLDQEDTAPSVK